MLIYIPYKTQYNPKDSLKLKGIKRESYLLELVIITIYKETFILID